MEISIRKAAIEDAGQIARLCRQLGYPMSIEATAENLEGILVKLSDLVLVASHDEKLIGWIHVFYAIRVESAPFCEVGGLVVDDQWRRKGVGKLLIAQVKPWCQSKGTSLLRVRTNIKRIDAHEFYSQLGFIENKQQKIFDLILYPEDPSIEH